MKKVLFTDLDGTLLNDQKEISPIDAAAIRQMVAEGHRIVIATGRPLSSAIKQAERLDLIHEGSYLIAYNGCMLYDIGAGRILYQALLPLPLVYEIFDLANACGIHIQTYRGDKILVEPRCVDEELTFYCRGTGMSYDTIPDIRQLDTEPAKLLTIDLDGRIRSEAFRAQLEEQFGDRMDAVYTSQQYLEIIHKGVSKGSAVRRMEKLLQIPHECTVSAGDASNDIPLLEAAHIGVAMRNSMPDAIAAADFVTERDNNHAGVAEIIERFILN